MKSECLVYVQNVEAGGMARLTRDFEVQQQAQAGVAVLVIMRAEAVEVGGIYPGCIGGV